MDLLNIASEYDKKAHISMCALNGLRYDILQYCAKYARSSPHKIL
jgi:septum formation topological specificity factor MinE